jgi:hypothetical protein
MKFEFPAKSVSASEIAAVLKNALPDGVFGKYDLRVSADASATVFTVSPGSAVLNGYVLVMDDPVSVTRPTHMSEACYIKLRHDKTQPVNNQFSFVLETTRAKDNGTVTEMELLYVGPTDVMVDQRICVRPRMAGQYHYYYLDNGGIRLQANVGEIAAVMVISGLNTNTPKYAMYYNDGVHGTKPDDGIVEIMENQVWIKNTALGGPVPPLIISVYTRDLFSVHGADAVG